MVPRGAADVDSAAEKPAALMTTFGAGAGKSGITSTAVATGVAGANGGGSREIAKIFARGGVGGGA